MYESPVPFYVCCKHYLCHWDLVCVLPPYCVYSLVSICAWDMPGTCACSIQLYCVWDMSQALRWACWCTRCTCMWCDASHRYLYSASSIQPMMTILNCLVDVVLVCALAVAIRYAVCAIFVYTNNNIAVSWNGLCAPLCIDCGYTIYYCRTLLCSK